MNRSIKQVIRYAALPGIIPRLKGFGLNFSYLAYLMAQIFSAVRLLPRGHAYLNVGNMGRYGVREVMAAGARNLSGGFKNIDQYVIYGAFLVGIGLLLLQFGLVFVAISVHAADAAIAYDNGGTPVFGMFHTTKPATDVALMMLDTIFQIPYFFNSAAGPDPNGLFGGKDMTAFSQGLHALFAFYSRGMLLIGALIILYYFFVVVGETAQTGVPFGERFDSIYVPIRMVIAIGLLVPTYYGLNSGQYLTLSVAKWGSGFATNAWLIFNNDPATNTTRHNPMGYTTQEMIVRPKIADITSIVNFYEMVHACRAAYSYVYSEYGNPNNPKIIKPYFVKPAASNGSPGMYEEMTNQSFDDALAFFQDGAFKIVFGEQNDAYEDVGTVKPYCGTIIMDLNSINVEGVKDIYDTYYTYILTEVWDDDDIRLFGDRTALIYFKDKNLANNGACDPNLIPPTNWDSHCAMSGTKCECEQAGVYFLNRQKTYYQASFESEMTTAIDNILSSTLVTMQLTQPMLDLGWGGAGVWFNRLAEFNGALVSASLKPPQPSTYPMAMEFVARQKQKNQPGIPAEQRFSPNLKEGTTIEEYWKGSELDNPSLDMTIAKFLDDTYRRINNSDASQNAGRQQSKNSVLNMINSIFGTTGLFELRKNSTVNPMSRIAALGRSIIEKSITYLGGALIVAGLGGLATAVDQNFAQGLDTISGVMSMVGMSGLTVGFIFYYLIPMMPFMYFFFAMARWVKTIFEAMVGVPLWALAHLKIDGEGIPAQAASNGYYLLLEIFVRPILTIFGLLLAFSSFNAMVSVLDSIFDIVVVNVGGYNPYDSAGNKDNFGMEVVKDALDQFVYTIVYAILLYLMATSSFKLIDLVPNGILRFIGAGVASFGDKAPDPMESLVKYTALAGYSFSDEMAGGIRSLGRGAGQSVGSLVPSGSKGPASEFLERTRASMQNQK